MRKFRRVIIKIVLILFLAYIVICAAIYFLQEKLVFHPEKLSSDFVYKFDIPFEEKNFQMQDGATINALWFHKPDPKGLIFYCHGNAGSLSSWGNEAGKFIERGYELFIFDYRGYGKSTGSNSQEILFTDAQTLYNECKTHISEDKIIIYGRSLGSGIAAHLASQNHACQLILDSPYYSLIDLKNHNYPFIPSFLMKYHIRTDEYLANVKCPVTVFHGTKDAVIYYGSSLKLQKLFKSGDTLVTIPSGTHSDLANFTPYKDMLDKILVK